MKLTIGLIAVCLIGPVAFADSGVFEKGTWNLTLTGSYITPIRFSRDHMGNFELSAGRYIWNDTSVALNLQGYFVEQPDDDDAVMTGVAVLARTHLLHFDQWSIFFDGGGGVLYADHTVPLGGTHYNLNGRAGLGATYLLQEKTYLIGGARYFHLSNGKVHGKDQNPSHDGIQIWGGVMWTW